MSERKWCWVRAGEPLAMVELKRIVVCGEIYSSNLGDGVIADCLAHLIKQIIPKSSVLHVDLSGRQEFRIREQELEDSASPIHKLNRFFYRTSSLWRRLVTLLLWHINWHRKFRHVLQVKLKYADVLIIGGGQLLMDNNLNFPLKVCEAIKCANEANVPVSFYACGVAAEWSRLASKQFQKALLSPNIAWISVRDEFSRDAFANQFGGELVNRISLDPALVCAEAYGIRSDNASRIIGLGITSPDVFQQRFPGKKVNHKLWLHFWKSLIERLESQGMQIRLFVNGAAEDKTFMERIVSSSRGRIKRSRVPKTPLELVQLIAGYRAVISHRLHANIIAFSLGVPSVGLGWDPKVEAFGDLSGRGEFFLPNNDLDVERTAHLLGKALSVKESPDKSELLAKQCLGSVSEMISQLTSWRK